MKATWVSLVNRNAMMMWAAVGMGGFSGTSAKADHNSFSLTLGAQRAGVWVEPVYESQPRTVTNPPRYEDVSRQVWREPVYETRRFPVETLAQTVSRRVPRYSSCGEFLGWEFVQEVVEPARTEWRVERVCVREGYYETVIERVLVRPSETRVVWEQVLVRPGHWETPGRLVIGKDRPFGYPQPVRRAELRIGFGD